MYSSQSKLEKRIFELYPKVEKEKMVHKVEIIDDDIEPNNDNIYDVEDFVSVELPYEEVANNDQISELANKWIFLE